MDPPRSRRRGRQRERQRLAVVAGAERVARTDRLLEAERDLIRADRPRVQVSSVSGLALPATGANTVLGLAALVARACSGCGSTYVPLTIFPVFVVSGSLTVSAALPAVLVTFAATVVDVVVRHARGDGPEASPDRRCSSASTSGTSALTTPFVLTERLLDDDGERLAWPSRPWCR